MTNDDVMEMIRRHEGLRQEVYLDTVGVPTVGYGHAFIVGSHVPIYVIERLFWTDFQSVLEDYDRLDLDLDDVRRAVVLDMLFNLGLTKFRKFRKCIKHIRSGNYHFAALEMLDSRWAFQVKGRAVELAWMMRTGEVKKND